MWAVVELSAEIGLEDGFCAVCVTLLGIERGTCCFADVMSEGFACFLRLKIYDANEQKRQLTRHVGNHGISTSEGVLCVAERVLLWCWLREPDISTVTAKVAALKSLSNILLDDDGTTCSVNEP